MSDRFTWGARPNWSQWPTHSQLVRRLVRARVALSVHHALHRRGVGPALRQLELDVLRLDAATEAPDRP
jgi:hypothetical protein